MKPVGKQDAGNPHVRFDERGWETGRRCCASARAHPRLYRHSPKNVGKDADVATCAGHVQQLGSESILPNLMEVKG